MDLDLPSGPSATSVPPLKKKRRSSILKMPTQIPSHNGRRASSASGGGNERPVLQDLNPNSPQGLLPPLGSPTPTPTRATGTGTFHRRQSSKRVSFSSCKMVKEFETGSHTLTVWNNTYEEDHSHATSNSQAEEDSEPGVQPLKKPRHSSRDPVAPPQGEGTEAEPNEYARPEELSLDLDRSVFPSPHSQGRLDMTVNATSAMELTRAVTPSPGAGGPAITSQTMELTLAPGDESGLSAVSTSRYTNGFLQGLDMTIGGSNWLEEAEEEEDLTQGVEMTKSLSRAYQLKLEDRPPPVRTDVSSALHYLQGLNAAPGSNAGPERAFRPSKDSHSSGMDLTLPLAPVVREGALTDHGESPEAVMSEEFTEYHSRISSVSMSASAGHKKMEFPKSLPPFLLASDNDLNESMELTKAVNRGQQLNSATFSDSNEGMELTKSISHGLLSKSSSHPNESMELTKAINPDLQLKSTMLSNPNESMELTKAINPDLQSKLAPDNDPNESMELTKAINPDLQSKLAPHDPNESMELTKAINPDLQSKLAPGNDPNESMELTKAINPDLQSKLAPGNDPNESMELTKAVNPDLQSKLARIMDPNESMELTKAVNPDLQLKSTVLSNPNESMELTKAINPGLLSKLSSNPNESMELTKAVNSGQQLKCATLNPPNKSIELIKDVNHDSHLKSAASNDPNESMELTKAVNLDCNSQFSTCITSMKDPDQNIVTERAKTIEVPNSTATKKAFDQNEDLELHQTIRAPASTIPTSSEDMNDCSECTDSINIRSLLPSTDQNKSGEISAKAGNVINPTSTLLAGSDCIDQIDVGSPIKVDKKADESMGLTGTFGSKSSCKPRTETHCSDKDEMEFANDLGALHNHGDTFNHVETSSNKLNVFQNVDVSFRSKTLLNAPDKPALTTTLTDRNEKVEITLEITESIKRSTNNTVEEENHVRRFTMGTEANNHGEPIKAIDQEIISPGHQSGSIPEIFQDSLREAHQEENLASTLQPTSQDAVKSAVEKILEQESGPLHENTLGLQSVMSVSLQPTPSKDKEPDPTEEHARQASLKNCSPITESSMTLGNTSVPQGTMVPEPQIKKTAPVVKPKRERISIFEWLARVQSKNGSRNIPVDHGRWELTNLTDWRSTLSFLHKTLVLNIALGYSLPVDESLDSSVSIKHWTISSIEFQNPTLTQMCSNGDPAIKLVHRLILRQLPANKLLKMCPSTLHLNEALASIGDVIRHGARFVLTLEDLASSHYYFAIHGLKITLGFLRWNLSFRISVNFSHLDNLDQSIEVSTVQGVIDEVTLKYLATSVFKRETMNEWKFLPEFVSEVEQYLDVSSKISC